MTDSNDEYDRIRCRFCGIPWSDHPENSTCWRHHPCEIPAWVGLAAAKIDDAAVARRELLGGVATTEFDHRANGEAHRGD